MKIEFLFFLTKFNENIPADFCKPLKMKAGEKVCTFPAVTARHIRILIRDAQAPALISEIQVFHF